MYRLLLILFLTAPPALAQTQADILRAQQKLLALGYDLTADGKNSLALKAAIRAYQRDWQLPEDGIQADDFYGHLIGSDPETLPRLQKAVGSDSVFVNPQPRARGTISHEGPCKAGTPEGEGKTTWRWMVNGDWKEFSEAGKLHDALLNGKGEVRFADGNVYTGDFVDGRFTGKGKFRGADGDGYIGNWVDDRPQGWGESLSDGRTYQGIWADGCLVKGTGRAAVGRSMESCGF